MASIPARKKPTSLSSARTKAASASARAKKSVAPAKAPIKRKAVKALPVNELEPRQQRFVGEYLIDLNATQAAIRAGYSARTAEQIAYQLLQKTSVRTAITAARAKQQERTQITADAVLREAWNIAFADPRELVQVKIGCCRHCHGEGFRYQRTIAEYNHDREEFAKKPGSRPEEFEEQGGIGFDPLRPPNAICPECGGDGDARVVIADTRNLSPQAKALYAGAKRTKFGIEMLMHSKMDAIEKLFKHLGLYEKDNHQKADPLAALLRRISTGNASSFRPVADDPEAPSPVVTPAVNGFLPVDDDPEAPALNGFQPVADDPERGSD